MPELPEVETLVRDLAPSLVGASISEIKVQDTKLSHLYSLATPQSDSSSSVQLNDSGHTTLGQITSVERCGKTIVMTLERGAATLYLHVHLRMTGRLLFQPTESELSLSEALAYAESYLEHQIIRLKTRPLSKYLRFTISTSSGTLYFFDPRRFGTCNLSNSKPTLSGMQIDPLENAFDQEYLFKLAKKLPKRDVKSFLLDQKYIVGIGNIYACEILYAANIHPGRRLSSLTRNERCSVVIETQRILHAAIDAHGTTFSDYQSANSAPGTFQNQLLVYGKEREPCKRCGGPIQRLVQQQRSTFYCPSCQGGSKAG